MEQTHLPRMPSRADGPAPLFPYTYALPVSLAPARKKV